MKKTFFSDIYDIKAQIIKQAPKDSDVAQLANMYIELAASIKKVKSLQDSIRKRVQDKYDDVFDEEDKAIARSVEIGKHVLTISKPSIRKNTDYDIDFITDSLKALIPQYSDAIDQIVDKNKELFKSEVKAGVHAQVNEEVEDEGDAITNDIRSIVRKMDLVYNATLGKLEEADDTNVDQVDNVDIINEYDDSVVTKKTKSKVTKVMEGTEYPEIADLIGDYIEITNILKRMEELKRSVGGDIMEEMAEFFSEEERYAENILEIGEVLVTHAPNGIKRTSKSKLAEALRTELKEVIEGHEELIELMFQIGTDVTETASQRFNVTIKEASMVSSFGNFLNKLRNIMSSMVKKIKSKTKLIIKQKSKIESILGAMHKVEVKESVVSSATYYAVYQAGAAIFGVGKTEDEAWEDAKEWVDESDPNWKASMTIKPCTEKLYNYVMEFGTPDVWDEDDGVLMTLEEKSKLES